MKATDEQLEEALKELELENEYLKMENIRLKHVLRTLAKQLAAAAIEVTDYLDVADEDLN